MKYLTTLIAVCSIAMLAGDSLAQPPGRGRAEKGAAAKGNGTARGKGPAANGQQRGEGRRGSAMQRDPADMAGRMIQQFDKDGDQKLNAGELAALLTSMRERAGNRGSAAGQRPGMERRKPGQDAQGKGRRKQDNENAAPGGDKPKRPASE